MLSGTDQAVPILVNVLWRPTNLCNDLGDLLGRNHLDRVPRADEQFVRVRFLLGDVNADLTAHTPFEVDLAPGLVALDARRTWQGVHGDAVDRTDFKTRLTAGAVVGVDDRKFFGDFLSWTLFGHAFSLGVDRRQTVLPLTDTAS